MLMVQDVPGSYVKDWQATQVVQAGTVQAPQAQAPSVRLPISNKAVWRWLQPYDQVCCFVFSV